MLSSTTSRVAYAGNDATTEFSFPYYFLTNADLVVTLKDDDTGVPTVKTITTHYTVSGAGNSGGGTVTMLTAPATGETLVIERVVALTQEVDYVTDDDFPAETHEQALDRLTMIVQQIQTQLDRCIQASSTSPLSDSDIGSDIDRADKVLAFDSDGELTLLTESATAATEAAASASAAAASAAAAAASAASVSLPATPSQGDILYQDGSSWVSLAKNATATRYLSNTGTNNNPAWAQVNLTNGVTGTLPIANGGLGLSSLGTALQEIRVNAGATALEYFTPSTPASVQAGTILDYGGTSAPSGYLECDGSNVSRTTYASLFTAIGTTWGVGDGSTTFTLPDLRRAVTVGSGGSGTATLGNAVGDTGGEETHTLTSGELPSHTHTVGLDASGTGSAQSVQASQGNTVDSTITSGSAGSGTAHNIIQPSAVVMKIIKT